METLFEILKIILPVIITGLFTFFITRYTYNKNRPLDKLEIAYNRVYYPLYKLIRDNNYLNDINILINRSKYYFKKYDKYIDSSTLRAFNYLCNYNDNKRNEKDAYQNFENNIYNKNNYLRRKLGYLQSNFIEMYRYSTQFSKTLFRILVEFSIIYILLMICSVTINIFPKIYNISINICAVFVLIILLEIVYCIIKYMVKRIINYYNLSKKNKKTK